MILYAVAATKYGDTIIYILSPDADVVVLAFSKYHLLAHNNLYYKKARKGVYFSTNIYQFGKTKSIGSYWLTFMTRIRCHWLIQQKRTIAILEAVYVSWWQDCAILARHWQFSRCIRWYNAKYVNTNQGAGYLHKGNSSLNIFSAQLDRRWDSLFWGHTCRRWHQYDINMTDSIQFYYIMFILAGSLKTIT